MRGGLAVVGLAAVLGGCATLRRAVPPPPPSLPPERAAAETPAPSLAPTCVQHPLIDLWAQRLRSQPLLREATEESLARGARYLPRMRAILSANGVPPELAFLPVVESGFEPTARGRHGELGLWQLRRPTARRFGLVVTAKHDERLQPERATEAAARYLGFLRARYGEWPLALAAYNAGERRVDRALAHDPTATFWQLADRGDLPRTSLEFVPHVMAVVRLADPAGC